MLETVEIPSPHSQASYSVIWLHGLGADGYNFVPIVEALQLPDDFNIRFVFPHAPIRPVTLNNGMAMRAWFDIKDLTIEGKIDDEGLARAAQEIEALIDHEVSRGVARDHIFIAGFSQGGALALFTALTSPHTLAGVIALSTYLPMRSYHEEQLHEANRQTPIFFAHGTYDPIIPYAWGEQSKNRLAEKGYTIAWHEFDMEHEVSHECVLALSLFFRERCKVLST